MTTRALSILGLAGMLLYSAGCISHFQPKQTITTGELPPRLAALVHAVWEWDVVRQNPGAEVVTE